MVPLQGGSPRAVVSVGRSRGEASLLSVTNCCLTMSISDSAGPAQAHTSFPGDTFGNHPDSWGTASREGEGPLPPPLPWSLSLLHSGPRTPARTMAHLAESGWV
ncbi:hypothetical protein H1C71_015442 [Ictidomys tridecemlineatus]|nr:hypothetical protein H1C71_015442 [Ictidomys tridecemlineatus]